MRILAVDHSAELGGAELGLVQMRRVMGDDLQVVLLEDGPLRGRLNAIGCEPLMWSEVNALVPGRLVRGRLSATTALGLIRAALQFRRRMKGVWDEQHPDVILLNTSRTILLAALAQLPKRLKCVAMLRDSPSRPYLTRLRSIMMHLAIRWGCDLVIANSQWTRGMVRVGRDVEVVAPFIDNQFFEKPIVAVDVPSRKYRVLILGRLAPWKGQHMGIRALLSVSDRVDFVTIAGGAWHKEGEYQQYLEDLAREVRDQLDVRLIGHIDDVCDVIDSHDIILHTSTVPEPFGQVVVQGLARARIVIAADSAGPAEIISHGVTGFLYRTGDAQSLAQQLCAILSSPDAAFLAASRGPASVARYIPRESSNQLEAAIRMAIT